MITKEKIKKEIDKLPESLLDEVYAFLQRVVPLKQSKNSHLTKRNFRGKLDRSNIRKAAYE